MTHEREPSCHGSPAALGKTDRTLVLGEAFEAHYVEYQYRFVEFLIEHLVDVGRAFDGDFQQMLVLAVLGQMHLRAERERQAGAGTDAIPPGITASRSADSSGIPRETVRRKLAVLAARGWVRRDPAGMWRIVAADGGSLARADLAEIDRRSIRRVARLVADLEGLA